MRPRACSRRSDSRRSAKSSSPKTAVSGAGNSGLDAGDVSPGHADFRRMKQRTHRMTKTRAYACALLMALPFCAARAAPMADLSAWDAAQQMGLGVNIGNTLDNTSRWETGWGNPPITKAYIERLAALGFKVVRLPVAWDTYARDGRIL